MTLWRSLVLSLVLTLGVLASAPPHARAAELDLHANWLDETKNLTPARFERVLGLVLRDPQGKALVDRAVEMMGVKNASDLLSILSLCQTESHYAEMKRGGQAFVRWDSLWVPLSNEGLEAVAAGKLNASDASHYAEALENARRTAKNGSVRGEIDSSLDFATVAWLMDPAICLSPALTLGNAVDALVHELRHLTGMLPGGGADPVDYANAKDYSLAEALIPGGEADAYAAGFGARARLEGNTGFIPESVRSHFNSNGVFSNTPQARQAMAAHVLSRTDLDYAATYRAAYRNRDAADKRLERAVRFRDFIDGFAKARRQTALHWASRASRARAMGQAAEAELAEKTAKAFADSAERLSRRLVEAEARVEKYERFEVGPLRIEDSPRGGSVRVIRISTPVDSNLGGLIDALEQTESWR